MFDFSGFGEFINIAVVLSCWIVGFVYKHYTKWSNKYIPALVLVLGILISIIIVVSTGEKITFNTILSGAISGLASTGCQEAITRIFNIKDKKEVE